jgi:tetratricopeptide (TPR) repeat protein
MTKARVRNRGVRASKVKLAAAMTKAGIKTQAALAARIAEQEGLDEPPRQAVSKVLRERPVDLPTLMRVARALDTPVYSLYLTTQDVQDGLGIDELESEEGETERIEGLPIEEPALEPSPANPAPASPISSAATNTASVSPPWFRRQALAYGVVLFIGAGALLLLWRSPSLSPYIGANARGQPLWVRLGKLEGDAGAFDRELRAQPLDNVTFSNDVAGTGSTPSGARALRVEGELKRVGRAVSVRLSSIEGDERVPFWSGIRSGPTAERELAQTAARAFAQHARTGRPAHSSSTTVIEQVMRGLSHLDSSPNELNLRRAQSEFEAALRIDPLNATAQAALCETLVRQSWIRDEQRSLTDAQNVCRVARDLDDDAPMTRTAYAHLLERTGRAAESHLLLEELVRQHPDDIDALLTATDSALQAFLETGEQRFLAIAEQRARRGSALEPDYWKTHWLLGRVEFHRGEVAAAIQAYEAARRLDANEYVLGNLGAMNFCSGDVARARDVFLEARQTKDNAALGEEYMGMIYYYLRDYGQSMRYRQRALDALQATGGPEIHQIWGDLGDSYRRSGRASEASQAYARAIQIVSSDFAQGNATTGDKAYRAYYSVVALESSGKRPSESERGALIADLDTAATLATEAPALLRAAIGLHLLGDNDRAREVAARASKTCRVYATHPDLQ